MIKSLCRPELSLFLFVVLVPPDITGEEQNVSVLISQAVELRCQSNAIPPPALTWLKDGRPLLKKPGLSISEDGSVLKVMLRCMPPSLHITYEGTVLSSDYNVKPFVVKLCMREPS